FKKDRVLFAGTRVNGLWSVQWSGAALRGELQRPTGERDLEPHHPFPPMDEWAPEDVEAHVAFLRQVGDLLRENGEYVDVRALTPAQTWVRYGGPNAAPVTTDGPLPTSSRAGTWSTSNPASAAS